MNHRLAFPLLVAAALVACAVPDSPSGLPDPPIGTAGPPVVVDCAPPGIASPDPLPQAGDLVPAGAIAARICYQPVDLPVPVPRPGAGVAPGPSAPVSRGGDTLYHGVDELVAALNALPSEPGPCTADIPQPATLVLTYPDGGRAELAVDLRTCRSVEYLGTTRYGGLPWDELFEAQRLATATGQPPAPMCTPSRKASVVWLDLRDDARVGHARRPVPYEPAAALVCRYRQEGRTLTLVDTATVTDQAGELARLVNSVIPSGDLYDGAPPYCPDDPETVDVLLFVDRAGGGYEIAVRGGDCPQIYPHPTLRYTPPAELLERIDAAVGLA